jgi:uncharacterized protein
MLIGREKEQKILLKALQTPESEMVAVLGRRRVGKTYLIRTTYSDKIRFEITGTQNAARKEQLANFSFQLKKTFGNIAPTEPFPNWQEAFFALITCWEASPDPSRNVIFFDELPWLSSRKSGFLNALSFFWNSWAVQKNIIVVICGSAASWMIQKVVSNRGGLHNRITKRIDLMPFDLYETELFLKSRNVNLDRYQILQLFMAMGGIPHYLNEVEAGKSAIQNIEDICFSKNGLLNKEFSMLYPALFDDAENHISIIRTLAQKWSGMSRQEIIDTANLPDGGGTTQCLEELEASGFLTTYAPFGKKKKESIYRLTDEYSLFYLKFIEQSQGKGNDIWQHLSQTQTYKSWSGFAFESTCLKHVPQIKKALGISGIYAEFSGYYQKGKEGQSGVQIDLLIDRNDNAINLFEIKFYTEPFLLGKEQADNLRTKRTLFKHYSQTKKHIFLSVMSTYGIIINENSLGLVDNSLTMNDLFEKI